MTKIRYIRTLACGLLILLTSFFYAIRAGAQSGGEATAGPEKAATSIDLTYTEANNRTMLLTATVKTKIDDTWLPVEGVAVHFYRKEVDPAQSLGTATTNKKGMAVFMVPAVNPDSAGTALTLVAAIEDNEKFEDNEEEITVTASEFLMTLTEEDSVRQVHVSLRAPDEAGAMAPVAEVDVHIYVQRLFGLLPISEDVESTDENGEITVDFPAGIPGDTAGNLVIVAKVEEHETYGNLEFRRKIAWGVPLVIDTHQHLRELWSSRANAPLYLIFFVNAMLIGIWGVIAYIVFEIIQIKRLGRSSAP